MNQRMWSVMVCCLVFGAPMVSRAEAVMPSLLRQFKSADPNTRVVAFSSAVARPNFEKDEAYGKAIVGLLQTEIAYAANTPVSKLQDDDRWQLYYKNVIATAARLHRSDSVPSLLLVMDKGDEVTQSLASMAPQTFYPVAERARDHNAAIRLAAATTLNEMLNPENESKISDHALQRRMEKVLKRLLKDKDPNIQNTAQQALEKLKPLQKRPESSYQP